MKIRIPARHNGKSKQLDLEVFGRPKPLVGYRLPEHPEIRQINRIRPNPVFRALGRR